MLTILNPNVRAFLRPDHVLTTELNLLPAAGLSSSTGCRAEAHTETTERECHRDGEPSRGVSKSGSPPQGSVSSRNLLSAPQQRFEPGRSRPASTGTRAAALPPPCIPDASTSPSCASRAGYCVRTGASAHGAPAASNVLFCGVCCAVPTSYRIRLKISCQEFPDVRNSLPFVTAKPNRPCR